MKFSLSAFDLVPSQAVRREWLVPNGAGGYSSSTVVGMNSRKYHGLLVVPLPGKGRHVMLSKFEETVKAGGSEFPISTNLYPGTVYPDGFRHQVGFEFSNHPLFAYALGGARLEKSVRMLHGKNAVVVSYRLASGREAELEIRPMLSPRHIHSDPKAQQVQCSCDRAGFEISKPAKMRVCSSFGKFTSEPREYRNMAYELEKERGYPFTETLFSPGYFSATLGRGDELHIAASLEMLQPSEALDALDRQESRMRHAAGAYCRQNNVELTDFAGSLLFAADSFVSASHKGIIAGYHWFGEWGRDSMISLPGLLLCTGRHALAREILSKQAGMMEGGLLPNFIGENGEAHYNSADASLWFVNAVREYLSATGDEAFVRERLWKHLRAFLASYVQGNRLVRMDDDCLLAVREPAATWMDAQVGGKAVTPRKGKTVEINALWHSNLHFMRNFAGRMGDRRTSEVCSQLIDTAAASFQKFVSHEGHLFDVLEPNDATVRPNQIFAVSLPHSPLNALQQKHVFNIMRSLLYTPLGLRTLSPEDPRYCGTYSGSPEKRDAAYHQGMVWPWLLGAFYDAQLCVQPGSERAVLSALKPFSEALKEGCVGTLPEMYEPDTMKPAGAVSQAWSVAEVLRIYAKVKKEIARQQAAQQGRAARELAAERSASV